MFPFFCTSFEAAADAQSPLSCSHRSSPHARRGPCQLRAQLRDQNAAPAPPNQDLARAEGTQSVPDPPAWDSFARGAPSLLRAQPWLHQTRTELQGQLSEFGVCTSRHKHTHLAGWGHLLPAFLTKSAPLRTCTLAWEGCNQRGGSSKPNQTLLCHF